MPRLLLCGFGPFPAAPANPAAAVIEALRDRSWSPPGVSIAYAVVPTLWSRAADAVLSAAAECDGVLLVGVAVGAVGFRVEMRAQNRTSRIRPDADGATLGRNRIDATGPASVRVTAPVSAMLAAIRNEGLPVEPSSNAGSYLCNFTLYRVLTAGLDGPQAGFLHVPQAAEFGGATPLADIDRGVRAAAWTFAQTLPAPASFAV